MTSMTDKPTSAPPAPAAPAAASSATAASPPRPPPEPFGQTGIRQYILPTLATVCFTLACAAAIMWMRSRSTADIFARRDGAVTWSVRSLYSRIVITRTDLSDADADDVPGIPLTGGGWQYASFEFPDNLPDGWQESWRKTLGVEWRPESLVRHPSIAGGWWMRIRWRTVTLLAMAPPIAIAILHDLRQRRRKQRAAAALALADDAGESPATASS
jgi:hypothetical protein